ncbi:hypothetical protein GBAR_LOCUS17189 [Geodia barretti]|uniref:Uncharacterized protein n=1 Tax=Geodia barretti TaxID=519541 RepID=A0AA35WVE3_GEOBA|nr:hypothetical protein GBAR_LOCUS17189 [Geodia barretti]
MRIGLAPDSVELFSTHSPSTEGEPSRDWDSIASGLEMSSDVSSGHT